MINWILLFILVSRLLLVKQERGKSIILGAIGLLLGNRADSKQIKQGEKKCTIEAHFDLSNYGFESFSKNKILILNLKIQLLRP